jgi:DNA replication protein DnaC
VLILGTTGTGKTFLANALAADTCRAGYPVLYIRLPDFFIEYGHAVSEHKEFDILKKYQKAFLLILDEFVLIPADELQQWVLFELLERHYGQGAIIFCSQFDAEGWHDQLGGNTIADSILDCITPTSYTITIQGDVSMRQRFSIDD